MLGRFAFTTVFALAASVPRVAVSQNPVDTVRVQGVLLAGEFFGPPNYGENPRADRIEHTFLLQLPAPASYQDARTHRDSKTDSLLQRADVLVQLVVYEPLQLAANRLVGKRVEVSGTLMEGVTGHHRTPVLIEVTRIRAIARWRW